MAFLNTKDERSSKVNLLPHISEIKTIHFTDASLVNNRLGWNAAGSFIVLQLNI